MPQYATIEGTAVELKIRSIPEREIVIGNQNNFKRLNITEEFKRVRLEKKGYEAATKLKTIGNTACSVYVSTLVCLIVVPYASIFWANFSPPYAHRGPMILLIFKKL